MSVCVWEWVFLVECAVFIARSTTFFGCPMHISAVGSDAVASKFFVAYFRVGATNSFAQAKEFAHTHAHTRAH